MPEYLTPQTREALRRLMQALPKRDRTGIINDAIQRYDRQTRADAEECAETMLGPATSLSDLRSTEECVVIADGTGALFVRATTDEDVVGTLRRGGRS